MKLEPHTCPRVRQIVQRAKAFIEPWGPSIECEVRRMAKATVRQLTKLARAEASGRVDQCKSLSYWLRVSPAAKFCSVILAAKGGKRTLSYYMDQALELNPRRASAEPVRIMGRPKEDGGTRSITVYGPIARANQTLERSICIARWGYSPFEVSRRGRGREAVVRKTLQHIRYKGVSHLVEADVKDFFPSVNGNSLAKLLHIPASIAKNTILISKTTHIHIDNHTQISERMVRTGLPLGSRLSPFIASKLLEPVLAQLGGSMALSFVDNIAIGASSMEEAERKKDTLAGLLTQHSAGPFTLRYVHAHAYGSDNDMLGYAIRRQSERWGGFARAVPSRQSILRAQRKLVARLAYLPMRDWHALIDEWSTDWARRYPCWKGQEGGATSAFIAALDHVGPHVRRYRQIIKGCTFGSFKELRELAAEWGQRLPHDPFYRSGKNWNVGILSVPA